MALLWEVTALFTLQIKEITVFVLFQKEVLSQLSLVMVPQPPLMALALLHLSTGRLV